MINYLDRLLKRIVTGMNKRVVYNPPMVATSTQTMWLSGIVTDWKPYEPIRSRWEEPVKKKQSRDSQGRFTKAPRIS